MTSLVLLAIVLFCVVQAAGVAGFLLIRRWNKQQPLVPELTPSEVLTELRTADERTKAVMATLDELAEQVFTRRSLELRISPIDDVDGLVAFLHSLAGVIALHSEESQALQRELERGQRRDEKPPTA